MKNALIVLITLAPLFTLEAQFFYAAEAGITSSSRVEDVESEFGYAADPVKKYKIGPVVGLNVGYEFFQDNWAVESGLRYMNLGYIQEVKFEKDENGQVIETQIDDKQQYHYLYIPLLLHCRILNPINFSGGVNLGFEVAGEEFENQFAETRKFDMMWTGGVGIALTKHLEIRARYYRSIFDIAEKQEGFIPFVRYNKGFEGTLVYRL